MAKITKQKTRTPKEILRDKLVRLVTKKIEEYFNAKPYRKSDVIGIVEEMMMEKLPFDLEHKPEDFYYAQVPAGSHCGRTEWEHARDDLLKVGVAAEWCGLGDPYLDRQVRVYRVPAKDIAKFPAEAGAHYLGPKSGRTLQRFRDINEWVRNRLGNWQPLRARKRLR